MLNQRQASSSMRSIYQSPDSVVQQDIKTSKSKLFISIIVAAVVLEILCWLVVPVFNRLFASALIFTGIDYYTLLYSIDVVLSLGMWLLVVSVGSYFQRIKPHMLAVPFVVVAYVVLIWLSSPECLGECGIPFWYDLLSFIKYPIFAAASIYIANALNKKLMSRF